MESNERQCEVWIKEEEDLENGSDEDEEESDIEPMKELSLPEKSKEKYINAYQNFLAWKTLKNKESFGEDVFLEYFSDLSEKFKPSSLWALYSMLKTMTLLEKKTDMNGYRKLRDFVSNKNKGYERKTTKIFYLDQVERYLSEAPDETHLAMKVTLIFGILGALRCKDFVAIKKEHVDILSNKMLVSIKDSSNVTSKTFTVEGKLYDCVKKYMMLRPEHCQIDRFFLNYQNGKCTIQVIGINKFASMGKKIAAFLNLPNPEMYLGHCFRQTSFTLEKQAKSQRSVVSGLFSRKIDNKYVNPVEEKLQPEILITEPDVLPESSSNGNTEREKSSTKRLRVETEPQLVDPLEAKTIKIDDSGSSYSFKIPHKSLTFNISNCSNMTLNFHY